MLARHDPRLVRDWPSDDQGVETDPSVSKNLVQLSRLAVVPQRGHELSLNTQACQVRCDVASSPRSLPFALDFNQGDWGFIGNAQSSTFEIAIQNQIADDEQLDACEGPKDLGEPVFVDFQSNPLQCFRCCSTQIGSPLPKAGEGLGVRGTPLCRINSKTGL